MDADVRFPDLSHYDTTEEKLEAVQNYLFMLLEMLRYTLRNLSMQNFNQQELEQWVDDLDIEASTIVTNTLITNELYSQYGAIADLVVNELRTDYKRALMYLAGDTSNIDYIYIHDEELNFITGTVKSGAPTEQLHHRGRYFWWRDETMTTMTSVEPTEWPVIVYQYDEAVKGHLFFGQQTAPNGSTYKVPVFKLGQGTDAGGVNGTATIVKKTDELEMSYTTSAGKTIGVYQRDSGYLDIVGMRKITALDFSNWDSGSFQIRLEGNNVVNGTVTFDGSGVPTQITVAEHTVAVTI